MFKVKSSILYFLLLLSFCLGVESRAQTTNAITFTNYQKKDGLPSNSVENIAKFFKLQ